MDTSKEFKNVGLSQEILSNLDSLGYLEMTPIQQKGLPFVLGNRDFIGQANTGSGKTAVFALGILSKLDVSLLQPQALVLCPTRELAEQVCVEIRRLARFTNNIKVLSLAGGTEERHKIRSLQQGAHIIVGTPGRIKKLVDKTDLKLDALKVLVLDEADRLLEMGFIDDINHIASQTPIDRQTMLFSATFPHGIKQLSASLQEDAAQVTVDSQHQQNTIKQLFFKVEDESAKFDALLLMFGHFQPKSALVFCNSRETCIKVSNLFKRLKVDALQIHSELEQQDRTLVLTKFTNKSACVLVATDLASRGLDIKDVEVVVNYDLPSDHELYIHRIGRTGRAGQDGLALSLFTHKERAILASIEDYLKTPCQIMGLNELRKNKLSSFKPSMTTIYVSAGRKDNIRPGDILGALTGEIGLEAKHVGHIRILEVNSYVAIDRAHVERALKGLQAGKIKGKKFRYGMA